MNDNELKETKREIRKHLKELKKILPKRVDPAFISHKSKIPYKMLDARASLLWRSFEMSENAYQSLNNHNIASGILLARGLVETSSILWHLNKKVALAITNKDIDEFDSNVMNILLGSRNDITEIKAVNILTIIDKIDNEFEGYKFNYNLLSEYAHPNWSGTHGLYAKINHTEFYTDYGNNIRNDKIYHVGFRAIQISLVMVEHAYRTISDSTDEFISICEINLDKKI